MLVQEFVCQMLAIELGSEVDVYGTDAIVYWEEKNSQSASAL